GGALAFPLNLSLNNVAAHYTPTIADATTVRAGDLLKVDIGAHVDGYIADSAFTWCSEKHELIAAVEAVIAAAVKAVRPGLTVGELSEVISGAAAAQGVGIIANLTGHGLDRWQFHAEPTIPNARSGSKRALELGEVIAIEPFVCSGGGSVVEGSPVEIFRVVQEKPVRSPEGREILKRMGHGLPFAKRWLADLGAVKVALALRELERTGAVESYPPLPERSGKLVAQAEHTLIVEEKPVVTTALKE
ncbi:MAG TPA: type II methionyl aminopeptidase, partial [archaeon]|nr:type II methionyl aminopeptidase [archaeon]